MSTILKALRRIEEERTQTAERPLRDEVVLAPIRSRRSLGVAAVAIAAMIGFAVTLALLSRLEGEPPPAAPVSAAAPAPVAVSPPPHVTAIVSSAAPPSSPAETAAPAGAVQPSPAQPAGSMRPVAGAAAAPPQPEPPAVTDEVIVPPLAHPVMRHWVDEDELDAPPARAAARPSLSVQVVRTRWHPRAERRAAWITTEDGAEREVREGDQVGSFVVREIDPDGVLFVNGRLSVRRAVGAP